MTEKNKKPIKIENILDNHVSLYDRFISLTKNHKAFSLIMILGVTVISIGSFTDAVSKVNQFMSKYFFDEQIDLIHVVVSGRLDNEIEFSIANVAKGRTFEITSIAAKQLKVVDLCRTCSFRGRKKLKLDLKDLLKNSVASTGTFELGESQLFGNIGTYLLKDNESYPFSIEIENVIGFGSVFFLEIKYHEIGMGRISEFVPPIVFYVGGPPDFRSQFIKVFDLESWPTNEALLVRQDLVSALAKFPNSSVTKLLRGALNDPDPRVSDRAEYSLKQLESIFSNMPNKIDQRG